MDSNGTAAVRAGARRRAAGMLALACFTGAVIPAAVSAPARAAARPAPSADPALTLQLLGLDVVENDGFIAASGPAPVVRIAADLFAGTGDYALFTGPNETGTGYLALTDDNPAYWVELQVPVPAAGSVINDTTDEVGFYTVGSGEGTLDEEAGPHTTENAPAALAPHAQPQDGQAQGAAIASPGVISGDVIQVPIHIPINLCGNSLDIVGMLNPTFGNTCVNG